jgi:hypothetical protein
LTKLTQLFDEAVSTPPPSRLTANGVLRAARARRQRVTAAVASLALVVGGMAVAIGLNLAGGHDRRPSAVTASPGPLEWSGRGDATHLYRVVNTCGRNPRMQMASPKASTGREPAEPVCNELWASADGGATWSSRGAMEADSVRIVGPQSLLRYRGQAAASSAPTNSQTTEPVLPFELSTDGGATWTALPPTGPPLNAVPPNGLLVTDNGTSLLVFDPSQGRVRPLAGPSLGSWSVSASGYSGQSSTLWFEGVDAATGRPAVVVAHAGETSWTPRLLPNVTPVIDPAAIQAALDSGSSLNGARATYILQIITGADGRTAYVTMFDVEVPQPTSDPAISGSPYLAWLRGFHTDDGGETWDEVGRGASVPGSRQGWVTADGRLVLLIEMSDPAGGDTRTLKFVAGGPDGGFATAAPPGLPTNLISVDGSVAYTDHAMYLSEDGWTWRQVWHD